MAYYGRPTKRTNVSIGGGGEPLGRYSRAGDRVLGTDPLGIGVAQRAREQDDAEALASEREFLSNPVGPAPALQRRDPTWTPFLQSLQEQGVGNVVGGAAPGSNQLVGISSQPNYFTQGGTFTNPNSGRTQFNADWAPTFNPFTQRTAIPASLEALRALTRVR